MYADFEGFGPIYRCPLRLLTPDVRDAMEAYGKYKDGYLPKAGKGWLEHPATMIDAIGIIENQVNRINAERIEEARNR